MRVKLLTAVVVNCLVVAFVSGASRGEACNGDGDCSDAGTTCDRGMCLCWADLGLTESLPELRPVCNTDAGCQTLYPNWVCRPSIQCPTARGKSGYCQPPAAAALSQKNSQMQGATH